MKLYSRTSDLWNLRNTVQPPENHPHLIQCEDKEGMRATQMGMYSTWVFSSKISSNYAVKHSQRQQRTIQDQGKGRQSDLNTLSCAHNCQLIQPLFTPQIWPPLSLKSLSVSLYPSLSLPEIVKCGRVHIYLRKVGNFTDTCW